MKYLAVFASFDKDSVVHPYVIYYLRELSKVADIIFVTDNFLGGDEIEKVKKLTLMTTLSHTSNASRSLDMSAHDKYGGLIKKSLFKRVISNLIDVIFSLF